MFNLMTDEVCANLALCLAFRGWWKGSFYWASAREDYLIAKSKYNGPLGKDMLLDPHKVQKFVINCELKLVKKKERMKNLFDCYLLGVSTSISEFVFEFIDELVFGHGTGVPFNESGFRM